MKITIELKTPDVNNLPTEQVLAISKEKEFIIGTLYRVDDVVYARGVFADTRVVLQDIIFYNDQITKLV